MEDIDIKYKNHIEKFNIECGREDCNNQDIDIIFGADGVLELFCEECGLKESIVRFEKK